MVCFCLGQEPHGKEVLDFSPASLEKKAQWNKVKWMKWTSLSSASSSFFLIIYTFPSGVAVKSWLIWFTLHIENKWIQLAGVEEYCRTINLCMYSLLRCQRLNECIFMSCDKMMEWGLQKWGFAEIPLQRVHLFTPLRLFSFSLLSASLSAACLALDSVHLALSSYQLIYI